MGFAFGPALLSIWRSGFWVDSAWWLVLCVLVVFGVVSARDFPPAQKKKVNK